MADPYDELIFQQRIVPHRSLDGRSFRILLMAFCACCFVSSLPFLILGAWPVVGFMGLDVLLFYWAFRVNFRDARGFGSRHHEMRVFHTERLDEFFIEQSAKRLALYFFQHPPEQIGR